MARLRTKPAKNRKQFYEHTGCLEPVLCVCYVPVQVKWALFRTSEAPGWFKNSTHGGQLYWSRTQCGWQNQHYYVV